MPLTSASHPDTSHAFGQGVHFTMRDGNKFVRCIVSTEALEDRALQDNVGDSRLEALFIQFREDIERIASRHYDNGIENPVVKTAELRRE